MSLRIDPATPADAPALARLFDAYRVFYQLPSDIAAAEAFVTTQIAGGVTRFFLARRTGTLVGFAHLLPSVNTLAMRPMWYLEDLYVDASARRQGIGEALLREAERFARDNGAERITLATAADNVTAQALYGKLGYQREERFLYFHRLLT